MTASDSTNTALQSWLQIAIVLLVNAAIVIWRFSEVTTDIRYLRESVDSIKKEMVLKVAFEPTIKSLADRVKRLELDVEDLEEKVSR